ncbi:TPA: hypothetical protein OT801_000042 [Morganella morganii]|uniref:hypothetical protein n=2 Tax=Morganella morganii TaxID=582 RepID=UPI0005099962|nr:hypothetical protein [Morganella morganii]SGC78717.1 Uncharacterised protein [Mycobacterium tuberculosis]SSN06362.1 Uncharacterised protein [Klebsiella pneumoniae]EJD6111242.1 hypothetical protein [Morganella morganii]EJG2205947.1 hypothetical protein [Morganella morganii]EKU4016991.1 hypothetical protein [Morganella morganii]
MNQLIVKNTPTLPALPATVLPAIEQLVSTLGVPRNVLASAEEIEYAWRDLPRELREIPENLRGELIARMCVAVSTGLFDGAMNYIWNAAILHLRDKIRIFGLPVVAQILQKDFEEKHLLEQQDSRLLELCLKLNIVDEDGFFFLDQCRDVRNNFSAAHPTLGKVNDREFTTFLNRCVRYALADSSSPKGVDIGAFISTIKGPRFNDQQCDIWVERLSSTHDAQRQILASMAHGIYCDPNTPEQARLNALDICRGLLPSFNASIRSELINNHTEYVAKGYQDKHAASLQFFEKLCLLNLLNESEQHHIFTRAIVRLWDVHNGMNNFYNEPAFAERLLELTSQGAVPETAQEQYVQTIGCCRVGNGYGVSNAAIKYYDQMIRNFSPREISVLIHSATQNTNPFGRRVQAGGSYRANFKTLLGLIDPASIPNVVRGAYAQFMR